MIDDYLQDLLTMDIPDDEWQEKIKKVPVKKLVELACALPESRLVLIPGALSKKKWRLFFLRLVRRIPDGNETVASAAFNVLHFYYRAESRRYVQRRFFNRNDIDDVVQNFWMRLWNKREKFTPGSKADAWLKRILKSKTIDQIRRAYRPVERTLNVDDHADSLVSHDHKKLEINAEVYEALKRLPPSYQGLLKLRYLKGYSIQETAKACGLTDARTKEELRKARERMRRILMENNKQRIPTSTKEDNHGTRL
jgi:RNA polymerase sigma-70 factor (ECF subfamily)